MTITEGGAQEEGAAEEKASDKRAVNLKIMERAWYEGEAQFKDGVPYVERVVIKAMLEKDGRRPRGIRNALNPSYGDQIIGFLINSGDIRADKTGWFIEAKDLRSQLALRRGERDDP